ncbi:MAG TPA: gliding motility lipoprotein GldJ [Flavobacteriaceae bacterium]|nr:gliding motility lipoprotein GldJ [Flavobacteriaceae bacterium]MCB9212850.1 gliding motility lipoprotein GldJ [Alteromonas sp.]HPF11478.1 gliding motility lipoprotein GldJ [Flavobacteriaceae bacterium]HQU20641.1 gliding motility lipoprotein GldJ [Flavobacteriaceae bacterium]HQU65036.1 gliding motility lipoprotein GldJ [Flavobacteriaceae bacterium]
MNVKNNLLLKLFLVIASTTLMVSCSKSRDYKNSSRATGWKMNAKEGGFQYNPKAKEQETGPGLVFIEGGTFTMGRVQDDPMHDWNNSPNQQHVQSFYMDETEVTNLMYLEYLDWIKKVFPPSDEKYRNIYNGAAPDTLVWRNRLGYNEVMTNNYLRHPAYAYYPVVGVSWVQAVEFSNWRTDRVNEAVLEENGITTRNARYDVEPGEAFSTETYLNAPTETYGGNDSITRGGKYSQNIAKRSKDSTNLYVQRKDGLLLPAYRLPTEAEWEYAALGLVGLRNYNVYRGKKKYPWEGQYTRSTKRRSRGDQLANFKQGDGDYGGIAGWSDDGADITAEVKSYEPNDFGLYDMAGNVAEWVADVYRPIVDDEYNDFNYYRGNVYTKNAIGEDGKVKVVSVDSILYDTLSNGRIVARELPGEILEVPVDENETYLRTNFSESDNRDYRDGDKRSTRYYQTFGAEDSDALEDGQRMYNSPQQKVYADSIGNLEREYDKSSKRTSLINNEVRVYKGGSWRDRDYWLDPAQRRYFPQDMATDYIGFRCAMSRVGSKSKKGKRPRNK